MRTLLSTSLLVGAMVSTASGQTYRLTVIDPPPSLGSITPADIGEDGAVLVGGRTSQGSGCDAIDEDWIWLDGSLTQLNPLPDHQRVRAVAFSDDGSIFGESGGVCDPVPVRWASGEVDPVALPNMDSETSNITDASGSGEHIVGILDVQAGPNAFTLLAADFSGDQAELLANPPGFRRHTPTAVNNHGAWVSNASRAKNFDKPILFDPRFGFVELDLIGGFSGQALDINDAGVIVGASATGKFRTINVDGLPPTWFMSHAVRWDHANPTLLPVPDDADRSEAVAINERGDIIGRYLVDPTQSFQFESHALAWIDGQMIDLTEALVDADGWAVVSAIAINNKGQIAAVGELNGTREAIVLTPID